MSYPVNVSVHVEGGTALADYNKLTLSQHVLTHHSFALDFSFEALGKALGIKPETLFSQAHEQLSGKGITIGWTSGAQADAGRSFEFKGIITNISIQTDADLVNYYHISGYSPTFLLEDGTQNRTFVKKTLQAIFQQVLGDYPGNPLQKQLKAQGNDVLPYVVQYNETNFNFLSRLAAQQGEWLYYDGTTLQLGRGAGKTIPFRSNSAQVFTLSMHLQPGKTEGAHYNYRTHAPLKGKAAAPAGGHPFGQFAVQKSDELFTQPHRLQAGAQHNDQAQLQRALDGLAAKRAGNQVSLEGSGEAFDTVPGCVLDVQDAAGAAYGKFRVLAVRHEVDGDGNYTNHFEAMPDAAPAPPPNPLYAASDAQPELAEVIDLDDPRRLGRVRVRYYWPVAQPADAESAWLRVSTPYSGDGKGQMFTPEVGSQVLIGYEHGLAEFPVALGNLFHPQNKQGKSYSPPNNNLKGMQTSGGNKFVMSEVAGAQSILLSNSNNKNTAIKLSFKGDGSIEIKSNGPITINSGDSISIEAKKDITMRAGDSISIEAKKNINVATQEENVTLQAHKELLLTAVTDDVTVESASKKLTIQAASNVEITSSAVVKVSGQDVKLNNPG
ncbi:type VI secretion system Vgr family protein [Hymenobacter monticola]|uniref:Type VI secretion system tip protein VgrG n=1 Tax=Hymenobacter monticola TaxID=1705399 RepID=A0ABY4B8K1_9BACT|nr:contractile injection system protein, VgrG/Pvc8 family [Hymenobacter monticola]UOE34316.1 type VI secretion system tip protein VgrG [Hymenobacter monticola]